MAIVTTPATGGGTETWSTDTGYTRVDGGGTVVEQRPLTDGEVAWLPGAAADQAAQQQLTDLFAQLQTLIDSVAMISTTAANDANNASDRRNQIATWTTAATVHAAVIRGIPSPTVAQIKEELAVAAERDVTIAGEIDNFYAWRAVVDALLMLLSQCVAGLARLATRTPDVAP